MSDDGDPGAAKSRTVGGRYRLLERIGAGAGGTVWRAHDELTGREVAVKQPRLPGDPQDEEHRRAAHRLHREARAAARVDHPSAVTIHDVLVEGTDVDGGLPWIVMELIRGESLDEVLARGPLAPAEAARIGLAALGALRAAHAVGIVHRDLKPTNVLLERDSDRVVLTDFGIAHGQGEESLTGGGEFTGPPDLVTPLEFVAPERVSGRGAGPASDLWSLGALLHAAVEGRPPSGRTTPESTPTAGPPEPEHAGLLGPLISRLLSHDPGRRPEAKEVAEILEKAAGEGRGGSAEDRKAMPLPATAPEPAQPAAPEPALSAAAEPALSAAAEPALPVSPAPAPPPSTSARIRRLLRPRPFSLTVLTVLLGTGAWLGSASPERVDSAAITEWTQP